MTKTPLPFATFQFVERDDGTLWMNDDLGLQLRDRDGRVLDVIRAGDGRGLPERGSLTQMSRAPDGGLWLSGRGGLLMWNDGARRLEPVPGAPEWHINGFTTSPDGRLWFAGTGVLAAYHWNGVALEHLQTFDAKDGLPEVPPGGIAPDAAGNLWLPTVRGLIRYEPEQRRMRTYGVHDGLPSQEFGSSPIHPLPGARSPSARPMDWCCSIPTGCVRTTRAAAGDRVHRRAPWRRAGRIAARGSLSLSTATATRVVLLMSFTDAHAHRYRSQLQGHDDGWVETDGGERVFSRLAPGDYVLQVQARTADSDWTPAQSLRLRVQRPWWASNVALGVFGLFALLVLWLVARGYRNRLRRRNEWQLAEHKREVAEQASLAKTRFLATLGHEVRTPMTGVLGMSELLLGTGLDGRQRGYVDSIRRAGEHLMRPVNDAPTSRASRPTGESIRSRSTCMRWCAR